jgi:hypothetical protein
VEEVLVLDAGLDQRQDGGIFLEAPRGGGHGQKKCISSLNTKTEN